MSISRWQLTCAFILLSFGPQTSISAATYYVSPKGNDQNPGTLRRPFASVQRTQAVVRPGDTVYIRGGTYVMKESDIAKKQSIFAFVIRLDKSGAEGKRINYWAYRDEKPTFDFSAVKPEGLRVHAFSIAASWIHIKGLEVVGVQVTIKGHTQSSSFENNGSHSIFENLSMHDSQAIGYYGVHGGDNLVLNCDAYNNYDYTSENGSGGNVDGFGCHPPKGGTGNVFRGCRAWFNSDDGYDLIGAGESVVFENCWAFYNGYSVGFKSRCDGNGFKAGGYGGTPVARLPNPIPRHTIRFCIAARNKTSGFYSNHHIGGSDWFNNSAYRNGCNFNMLCRLADNVTDVPGYDHRLHNNMSYNSRSLIGSMDADRCELVNNSFNTNIKIEDEHFVSLDETQLMRPRKADGSLPEVDFLRPEPSGPVFKHGLGAFAK